MPAFLKNRKVLLILGTVVVIIIAAAAFLLLSKQNNPYKDVPQSEVLKKQGMTLNEAAERIGASPNCQGTGPVELGALPMNKEDFAIILPYGLMVGAHVTPIDHWYFSPTDFKSARDTYPVYAMADGILSQISQRGFNVDTGEKRPVEYRLVFTHTCTFLTYYDLVTSLDKTILDQVPQLQSQNYAQTEIAVKAGQLIGRIGGQTLDFAVWDLEKPLSGFANPKSYSEGDPWKIYTANPYDYVSSEIKQLLIDKNPRTVEPTAGKIDYDIDGKMVGNWFRENTNGYKGLEQSSYWRDHLALVYNYLDPTAIEISIGDWSGDEAQFAAVGNGPDPATVGTSDTPTKYELVQFSYQDQTGKQWDNMTLVKNLKVAAMGQVKGVILVQLQEAQKLKVETFPGKTASQVTGFTSAAKIFVR